MRVAVLDIETDSVQATRIWVIVTREVDTSERRVWLEPFDDFIEYSKTVDMWVAHNGLSFDFPVINRLLKADIPLNKVVDTFIVSRTVNYSSYMTHGLDEIGASLGIRKIPFNDFSQLTDTMITYCKKDVDVTLKVYNKYRKYTFDKTWAQALRVEHDISMVCDDMQTNGFPFNTDLAKSLLDSILLKMSSLEDVFQKEWPPELVETNRIKYRVKQDGTLFKNVEDALNSYPKTEVDGNELVCYDYKAFNPGSTAQRVSKLWGAGWKPTEKTKTHYEWSTKAKVGDKWRATLITPEFFKEKKEHFEYYGWTVSEENLLTLPEDAPEAAKGLAEWLTLEGRRSSLVEWLGQVKDDNKIHGKFWHIGAWTGRMAHSSPNSANIASVFHGEPTNAVETVKAEFDGDLRKCWQASEGNYLVGTDAEGIQLRILAHYLKSDDYVHAIVSGKKEDETDIHNVNKRALGLNHIGRGDAKTFIYAHVLGAGLAKTARILRTNEATAKSAVQDFQQRLGLDVLRRGIIDRDAKRGYFDGVDGRKVLCNSTHLMLAGYLQNGEAVIMKHANLLWRKWADEAKIRYRQINFVHDEWQTECLESLDGTEYLAKLQRDSIEEVGKQLGIYCPLAGSSAIGRNWYDTH